MDNLKEINCKEIFRNAYEKRYTWDKHFNGYRGKCILSINENLHEGEFLLGNDCKPEIKGIDDEKIKKNIESQLFEVSIHRVKRDFQSIHAENNFKLYKNSAFGIEMMVVGKNEGDKYRVKDNCINMVFRKIHGVIIEIFVKEFFDTGNGFLSKKYSSQQLDPISKLPKSNKFEYEDNFKKISSNGIWVLESRTIKSYNEKNKEIINKFIFSDLSEI